MTPAIGVRCSKSIDQDRRLDAGGESVVGRSKVGGSKHGREADPANQSPAIGHHGMTSPKRGAFEGVSFRSPDSSYDLGCVSVVGCSQPYGV